MKMHHYILSWGINVSKSATFIYNTVRQVIRYAFSILRTKSRSKVSRASEGKCDVKKEIVIWLGTHAFHAVLSMKPALYTSSVLKSLAFELSLAKNKRVGRRFRGVVSEALEGMRGVQF
ncbi:hypothetical protein BV22DRAFT_1009862 [Leucogyrophana mollusca]|uniref:Uncharacterized protein n=1 Tax=Leucogyrophana mollusca TaxID=85980 RepID=A0ACB8BJR0_9AGAM|nr:hypothetical protein BV22DRAFT_1009862 [Leucogyrophana mollusca]